MLTSIASKFRLIVKRVAKITHSRLALAFFITILIVALVLFFYRIVFWGKIFPGVYVGDNNLGGRKKDIAAQVLSSKVRPPEKITLSDGKQIFEIQTKDVDFSYDYAKTALKAYETFRTGNFLYDFAGQIQSLRSHVNIDLEFTLNATKLNDNLSVLAGQVSQEAVYPSVKIVSGKAVVENGIAGKEIDSRALSLKIGKNFGLASNKTITIPFRVVDPRLSESELGTFQKRAQDFVGKKLSFNFEYQTTTLSDKDLVELLNPKGGHDNKSLSDLVDRIAKDTSRPPQNATFVYLDNKVQEFTPAKDGVTVDKESLKNLVISKLSELEEGPGTALSIEIPTTTTTPKITTSDVNNLGIRELIGRGSSRFRGSISSRIHNISLAASKFNSVLIAPGETFSFNDALGDVSIYTGYKQAYIIKDGKTVLGDGGGVCQVSTTLFRAALNAGLPIVERTAHSYRVGYYEQDSLPGLDATVYDPTTDLKIKNDTPGHILIQTHTDTQAFGLVFELYGTSDDRVASVSKPVITNQTPPPDDLYQDDPTLPSGVVKQIDWKAWGARVYFNYEVKRNQETIYAKTFYSNYHPWQAVYLRGTGPAQ